MKVTKIETQKHNKNKLSIFIDDKYSFSITLDTYLEGKIHEDNDITEEDIEYFKKKDEPQLAFQYIVFYVGEAIKPEKRVREKLREKGYSNESIDLAIEKAKNYGFIDDVQYAEEYIEMSAIPRGYGEFKIRQNLIQKGINRDIIDEKLSDLYSEKQKYSSAYKIAEKKYERVKDLSPFKARQKVVQTLISKGFSYDLANEVLNDLIEE